MSTTLESSSKPSSQSSAELEHVKDVWSRMQGNSPIYDFLFSPHPPHSNTLTFLSASKGTFKARLLLSPHHVNSRGTLHGSVSATIVDWAGGLAIASHGMERTGASVDIHVTYQSTAHVGDTVEIEGTATKVGRCLAFTNVAIKKVVDGKAGPVVASASHTKYIRQ